MYGKIFLAKKYMEQDNNPVLINPILELGVPFLPTTQNLQIVCLFIMNHKDLTDSKEYSAEIDISNEKEIIHKATGTVSNNLYNMASNMDKARISFVVELENVVFKDVGMHKCTLRIADNVYDYDFYISKNG